MPSTRPRIEFDENGICNGCNYSEWAKTFNWSERWKQLEQLCNKYRGNGIDYDIIIPFSGGKDSYHIAWNFKQLGMKPLLIKLAPMIPTNIGKKNEMNIRKYGFDLIIIYPDDNYRKLNKIGLIEQGRGWFAFETGITTAIVKMAIGLNIKWLCFGEEGESIYGGKKDYLKNFTLEKGFTRDWIINTYFSGHDTNKYKINTPLWQFPSQEKLDRAGIFFTHWSYFSDYDPQKHLQTAKKMGFVFNPKSPEDGVTNYGTFTNYTSLDDPFMRTFNTHLMHQKFGFGRGTHEATTEIRYGRMTREEGIKMAEKYDSYDCRHFFDKLAKYYGVSELRLKEIINSHANKSLLEYKNGKWQLKPEIHHGITIENAIEIDYDGSW
jgi:N-acetyl sugar amidotransferase